jgi:hypothetical protein
MVIRSDATIRSAQACQTHSSTQRNVFGSDVCADRLLRLAPCPGSPLTFSETPNIIDIHGMANIALRTCRKKLERSC